MILLYFVHFESVRSTMNQRRKIIFFLYQSFKLSLWLFLSYFPLIIFILHFCLVHFSYTIKAMDLKLHRMIDLIAVQCTITGTLHFWIFGSITFVNFHTCAEHKLVTIIWIGSKFSKQAFFIDLKCSAQESLFSTYYF